MYIKALNIQNFKSFENVTINFNSDLNIFTGLNSSGKTTILEAVALWHECFALLLRQRGNADNKNNIRKGEYILGGEGRNYFTFESINSVRCPNYQDIFRNGEINAANSILLKATISSSDFDKDKNNGLIDIPLIIKGDRNTETYNVILQGASGYSYRYFNDFFANKFPLPISVYYASPVATIQQYEYFVTQPRMNDSISRRNSASVLRNRLYQLYEFGHSQYKKLLTALNEILYGGTNTIIEFKFDSKIQSDIRTVINFKTNEVDTPKDIALLGSGALQIIEILLNVFTPNPSALNIILLDEPDSHIHRDIQRRLLQVLSTTIKQQQIFLTTHNEALIRAASPQHLFHIESTPTKNYFPISLAALPDVANAKTRKSFSGAYPLATNAIMRAMGSASGLDIMNALEADKIIFVEGEDDAQAIYTLLQRATTPSTSQKFVFWVLNGISNLPDLLAYQRVFGQIQNQKTLWQKSLLIMDRDFIMDKHFQTLPQAITLHIKIPVFVPSAYTFEATLFTNMNAAAKLLKYWLNSKNITANDQLGDCLNMAYFNAKPILAEAYNNDKTIEATAQRYRALRESPIFGQEKNNNPIKENDIQLTVAYKAYVEKCLSDGDLYKLMHKDDVAQIINKALAEAGHDIIFDISQDFIALLSLVDFSTWISEWDFLRPLARN